MEIKNVILPQSMGLLLWRKLKTAIPTHIFVSQMKNYIYYGVLALRKAHF